MFICRAWFNDVFLLFSSSYTTTTVALIINHFESRVESVWYTKEKSPAFYKSYESHFCASFVPKKDFAFCKTVRWENATIHLKRYQNKNKSSNCTKLQNNNFGDGQNFDFYILDIADLIAETRQYVVANKTILCWASSVSLPCAMVYKISEHFSYVSIYVEYKDTS